MKMLEKFRSKAGLAFAAFVAALAAPGLALAQTEGMIDETELVGIIEGAAGPVGAVIAAVLVILAGILTYTLVRRVMGR